MNVDGISPIYGYYRMAVYPKKRCTFFYLKESLLSQCEMFLLFFSLRCCSIAILLYMCRKFKTPDHWYPSDLQKQAKVDEYLSWQHAAIRAPASKLFWFKVCERRGLHATHSAEKNVTHDLLVQMSILVI